VIGVNLQEGDHGPAGLGEPDAQRASPPSISPRRWGRATKAGGSTFRGGEETEPVVLALSVAGTRQHWRPSLKPMPLLLAEGVNMEAC